MVQNAATALVIVIVSNMSRPIPAMSRAMYPLPLDGFQGIRAATKRP
jgi:hypothetical protein